MRKRRNSDNDEESSSEMEVDDEQKLEANEDGDGADDDDEMSDEEPDYPDTLGKESALIENPFLDSFYSLSSEDLKERSKAAQTMLHHCLLSSGANSKDAAYAFRRLLNGICSGRAAARQGNASALTSFLKLAFQLKKMEEIREESMKDSDSESLSLLAYVRHRLIAATDANQITGKKKGSEERDYQFGRLFGILSFVRSNVLVSQGDENGYEETKKVATALAMDLAELFWLKRWMREPAAHGMTTLLKTFCEENSNAEQKEVANHLVEKVVIPEVLLLGSNGEENERDHSRLVGTYCAEQLGIALFVQSQPSFQAKAMSYPLNEAIMSKATVKSSAHALSVTSAVVQPRSHFVWDSLWCYLSRPVEKSGKRTQKGPETRELRDICPGGQDSASEVLDLIIQEVVMQKLLHLDPEKNPGSGKATHERRALALGIVKVLVGVPFLSSVSGASRLVLEGAVMEHSVLSHEIVKTLFLEIICAGSDRKKTSHLLKPLALNVLKDMAEGMVAETSNSSETRRLAVARALLGCEIRFDARTKTATVSDILGLVGPVPEGKTDSSTSFWNGYLDNLHSSFVEECSKIKKDDNCAKATGFIELMYSFAKNVLALQTTSKSEQATLDDFKKLIVDRIMKYFMAAAFFNCKEINGPDTKTPKKKKVKKPHSADKNPILKITDEVKRSSSGSAGIVHQVRSVISARFFSLLADFCGYATRAQTEDHDSKVEKDSTNLAILVDMCDFWKSLEALGAKRYGSNAEIKGDDDSVDPEKMINQIQNMVTVCNDALSEAPGDSLATAKKRCCTGIAVLGFSLYLHRLSCGEIDQDGDNPDADDENDEEEICNALEGLKDVADEFMQELSKESNPLLGLAELCANILSSPLGSGNMGRAASPKLVREAVRFAWLGGLRLASDIASDGYSLLDSNVMAVLLEAVGAANEKDDGGDDGSDDEDDDDGSESSGVSTDNNIFSKAADVVDDSENMDKKENSDDDSDIELDPTKLQSMLEEDSDADVGEDVLEHHEGADAALAKLIKLKQDTRKVGRQAREKIEIDHQLRCTFLLELLFGRPDSLNRLFGTEVLLGTIIPILKYRKKLERSLRKSIESGTESSEGSKKALMDRLTTLLNQRICKMKMASFPLAKLVAMESASEHATKVLEEARHADTKEQFTCCSNCLVFTIRSSSDPTHSPELPTILEKAVTEWSTKRTSKLQASLFDDIVVHLPNLSQALLADPLSKASQSARSPFLKGECFRLITLLFAAKANVQGQDKIERIRVSFLDSVVAALQDEEMRKAKRVRVVLKALEKFVAIVSSPVTSKTLSRLDTIKGLLEKLGEGESQGVTVMCTKLISDIDAKAEELKAIANPIVDTKNESEKAKAAQPSGEWDVSKSKKGKKNKKKKR